MLVHRAEAYRPGSYFREQVACCQAGSLGITAACMDVVVPYMHERKQFGQPIGDFQLMQGNRAARCWRAIGATFW